MSSSQNASPAEQGLFDHSLAPALGLSLVIALLLAIISAAGLLWPQFVYPNAALRDAFLPNDAANLAIGLPVLLLPLGLAWKKKPAGRLLLPGALLFVIYNEIVYLIAIPNYGFTTAYGALIGLSLFALFELYRSIDREAVRNSLAGAVRARLSGGVLAGLGLLFLLRAGATLASALASRAAIPGADLGLHTADIILSLTWIAGGVLLWRRTAWGYTAGLGLLLQGSALFASLLALMLIRPYITTQPFIVADFMVILVMSLVCFIPFGLYARAAARASKSKID